MDALPGENGTLFHRDGTRWRGARQRDGRDGTGRYNRVTSGWLTDPIEPVGRSDFRLVHFSR